MKVGIIGAGAVGSACLTALVARGCAREIVVLDRDRKKARGLVTDVQYVSHQAACTRPHQALHRADSGLDRQNCHNRMLPSLPDGTLARARVREGRWRLL